MTGGTPARIVTFPAPIGPPTFSIVSVAGTRKSTYIPGALHVIIIAVVILLAIVWAFKDDRHR